MSMLEPLRLELSADELALLTDTLASAPPADRHAPAVDSLQRRGLMNVLSGGGVQLDEVVGAVLGTCAYPTFSIVVHQASPRGSTEWSIHYAAEIAVERRRPSDERYVFTAFASAGQLLDRLVSALDVADQPRPEGELIALERAALQSARDAAATGTLRETAEALRDAEVPAESSHSIANVLTSFEEITQLLAFQHSAGNPEPSLLREVLLLRGPSGFWAFVGPVEDSDELYAAPMSGVEVRLLLTALLALAMPA
jgi:hypothetical protein